MTSSSKQAQDQPGTSEPTLKSLRTKMSKSEEKVCYCCLFDFHFLLIDRNKLKTHKRISFGNTKKKSPFNQQKKLKDIEISVPIVYGNVAFWLGKKASE